MQALLLLCGMSALLPSPPSSPRPSLHATSHSSLSHASRILSAWKLPQYEGALLGVTAKVELNRSQKRAELTLSGWPIGGTVQGSASFAKDPDDPTIEEGDVVLDDALSSLLKKRLVSVHNAGHDPKEDTVHVTVRVPVFGLQTILLFRVRD